MPDVDVDEENQACMPEPVMTQPEAPAPSSAPPPVQAEASEPRESKEGDATEKLVDMGKDKLEDQALEHGTKKIAEKVGVELGEEGSKSIPGAGNLVSFGKAAYDIAYAGLDYLGGETEDMKDRIIDAHFDSLEAIPGYGNAMSTAETASDLASLAVDGKTTREEVREQVYGPKKKDHLGSRMEPVDEAAVDEWMKKHEAEEKAAKAAREAPPDEEIGSAM